MPAFEIPSRMRALVLHAYGELDKLALEERAVPRPQAGHVLIRMHASPINPSDAAFLAGVYSRKALPVVPGFEGSGVVVAAGNGWYGKLLLGRRVACVAANEGDGTWAEYVVASALTCIPLKRAVSLEQGAMHLVNPMTAWLLMAEAERSHLRAIVQTAAAGALGKMIVRLAQQRGVATINIVRREEQAATLRHLGATWVLNGAEKDFEARLFEACRALKPRLAFDAVGGELTGKVLGAMPNGARLISYGALEQKPLTLDPRWFIAAGKSIEGFQLGRAMSRLRLPARLRAVRNVRQLLTCELQSDIQARLPLEEAVQALQLYLQNMSAGKVLLLMNRGPGYE
jgi:NADPH:quinone reductase-like Zn-dependent oxidoreductase